MARTPNWKVSVPHDPRYEWRELKAVVALVEITFAGGHEFNVGDSVWDANTRKFSDQLNSSDGFKVVEVNKYSITIEIPDGKGSELSRWDVITNGDVEEKIKEMSGGKQTRWNLKGNFSSFSADTQLKNLVIWVERADMPMPLAAPVDDINSDEGVLSSNLYVAAGVSLYVSVDIIWKARQIYLIKQGSSILSEHPGLPGDCMSGCQVTGIRMDPYLSWPTCTKFSKYVIKTIFSSRD